MDAIPAHPYDLMAGHPSSVLGGGGIRGAKGAGPRPGVRARVPLDNAAGSLYTLSGAFSTRHTL
jgi:hypothetical protein